MFSGTNVKKNVLLAPHTTFKLGGVADFLAIPKTLQELSLLLKEAEIRKMPVYFIGNGSNLLISDHGVRGLVICLSECFNSIAISPDGKEIIVGAGYSFAKLSKFCLNLGWEVALGWIGIPGSVGGALKMNAGTNFGEIGHVVKSVGAINSKETFFISSKQMNFSYRNTEFQVDTALYCAYLINKYARPNQKEQLVKKAIELVKQRKQNQPIQKSAGSIFKNPGKKFAGQLIELCNLKGYRIGGAKISEKHGNFFVNDKEATSKDMFELCQFAKNTVYDKFKIKLDFEVKFWGFSKN